MPPKFLLNTIRARVNQQPHWYDQQLIRTSYQCLPGRGFEVIELSVKQEKHSTKTLSLVIHRLRFQKKKTPKKCISIQRGMKLRKPSILVVNWVSSCLSFFLNAATAAATYIFTAPNCTITVISFEPRALNAEFQHFISELQRFILRFNKMSLLCGYQWKRG